MFVLQRLLRDYSIGLHNYHGNASGILDLAAGIHANIRPEIPPKIIVKIPLVILSGMQFENL